jgi:hypothetical protein
MSGKQAKRIWQEIPNCTYGVYIEPPSNIDKLEPNV